jgi:hypothetical protein
MRLFVSGGHSQLSILSHFAAILLCLEKLVAGNYQVE